MTEATQTLAQLKKTSKLTRLAFHKNGPKSFRRGQGALLNALLDEAAGRGHMLLNLGLGINPGVAFFKRKWNARPWLPYVETSWEFPARGRLARLAALFKRGAS